MECEEFEEIQKYEKYNFEIYLYNFKMDNLYKFTSFHNTATTFYSQFPVKYTYFAFQGVIRLYQLEFSDFSLLRYKIVIKHLLFYIYNVQNHKYLN